MKPLNMRKNETPGLLITFCGLDGCGKTTMMKRLIADLEKDHALFVTKQPTNTVRNSEIFRTYMDCSDHDAFDYRSLSLLAASDRLQHVNKVIEPEMKNGKIVLSDRYFYSCLSNLRARGFEQDEWIYEIAKSVIKPDIAFFFDVPVEEAVARVRRRLEEKDRYIDMELQYKLRREYLDICTANEGILISTLQTEDECYSIVKQEIQNLIKKKQKGEQNMNEQMNSNLEQNLLNQRQGWYPNFNEECDFELIPEVNRVILRSENENTLRRGLTKDVILNDTAYTYHLSCDLKIQKCGPRISNSTPCGAYIAIYNVETKETKRTQRYSFPMENYVHLDLSLLILNQHKKYRIGLYVDGVCTAEFTNIHLQKGERHNYLPEEDDTMI